MRSIKPASLAGFLLAAATPAYAQDYVDVAAERRAIAKEVMEDSSTLAPSISYTGIQPYSGSTTVAQAPLEATTPAITGSTDSGSLILRIQQLESDIRRLNGLLEDATQALRSLEAQTLERYVELDRRLAARTGNDLDEEQEMTATENSQASLTEMPVGGRLVAVQEGEEGAYRAAYELVREKEFDNAVEAFKAFLAEFPFGRYAPNANYWLGELYLVLDPPDPELARQSFKLLLNQYPADPKVPGSLYKLGIAQLMKGNRQRSKEYLDEVIREYPAHSAAQLARQFLLENF